MFKSLYLNYSYQMFIATSLSILGISEIKFIILSFERFLKL